MFPNKHLKFPKSILFYYILLLLPSTYNITVDGSYPCMVSSAQKRVMKRIENAVMGRYSPVYKSRGTRARNAAVKMLVPAAAAGATVAGGRRVAQAISSTMRGVRSARRRVTKKRFLGSGRYRGKFPNPSRKGLSGISRYANSGLVDTTEISGQLDDPDCVYLTHMALDPTQVVTQLVQALLRKLFRKHGIDVGSIDQRIAGADPNSAAGFQIRLIYSNISTNSAQQNFTPYDTLVGDTLRTIAAQFVQYFFIYSSMGGTVPGGGQAGNTDELFGFQLYILNAGVFVRSLAAVYFADETLCLYGKSDMKVQNRTQNGSGTDDTDNVQRNPLMGKVYQFNGVPKTRVDGAFQLNAVPNVNGVKIVRAAQMTNAIVAAGIKEPPLPRVFYNCTGSSAVRLEPGDIKQISIVTKMEKKMLPFLRYLKYNANNVLTGFETSYSIFKSQMIALEDVINVDAAEKITVAYEVNRVTGVMLKTSKNTTAMSDFRQFTINNFTP